MGILGDLRVWGISFLLPGGVLGLCGSGGPRRGFRTHLLMHQVGENFLFFVFVAFLRFPLPVVQEKITAICRKHCWGTPLPESCGERLLFRPSWKMWRIFREISCCHFSWKSKGENLQMFSPNFRCLFRPRLQNNSPEFRSQEIPSQNIGSDPVCTDPTRNFPTSPLSCALPPPAWRAQVELHTLRTRLSVAASIAFMFRLVLKGFY